MKILPVILLFLLAGCATGYHPLSIDGGYTDSQYSPNTFRVIFRGNGYTSMERAQDLALLRCSELALTNGFHYFQVINESDAVSHSYISTPGSSTTTGYFSGNAYYSTTIDSPPQTIDVERPHAEMFIRCYPTATADGNGFDADFLYNRLMSEYHVQQQQVVSTTSATHH